MTKKSLLAALNAAEQVKCTMIGGFSVEDWPDRVAWYTRAGWALAGDTLRKGTQFIMKPKLNRIRVGKFKSSSTNYTLSWGGEESHGYVKDLKEVDGALEMTMFNGAVLRYEVAKAVRKFLVLDSSRLAFYKAPENLCKNFDGLVLEFLHDRPELGQVILKQPPGHAGTVALDYANVQEVV